MTVAKTVAAIIVDVVGHRIDTIGIGIDFGAGITVFYRHVPKVFVLESQQWSSFTRFF
jgi:hypothetical protein